MAKITRDKQSARAAMVSRLLESKDFREWLYEMLEEFCAFEQGFGEVDQFRQGIRAAGSWAMASLKEADGSAAALGAMYERHFTRNKLTEDNNAQTNAR